MTGPRISVRPSLPFSVYRASSPPALPWPLEEPGCRLYARARHGLWHGLRALGLGPGDDLLVPAYHHGSEVEAIAHAGINCRFYETPQDLVPDAGELDDLLARHPGIKGLFLIHYLGIPQDSMRWRRWCDERDILLIEDAAQAFLATQEGRPVGSAADLAVFCIYKTYGVIDGAAMICARPPEASDVKPPARVAQTLRRNLATLAQRSSLLAGLRARVSRGTTYDIARDFGLGTPDSAPARATSVVLGRALATDAAALRRENYRYLLDLLVDSVPPVWRDLPEGASPFCFPVATADKQRVWRELVGEGVIALNLWSVPHPLLEVDRFPSARLFREEVIGLPLHQGLGSRQLDRVVDVFRSAGGDDLRARS